ncbi:hypothetical protein Shyhy01_42940 [Streptomyces hygroscopicus subsp. hygroscopicus]|uniref:hypothetical protein n=1 Tax=Streptomyces sp. KHY 26 TaxID=3097359 RepID=UPI0024A3338C|nr:hypothetical protein [Streptomyces hygroscopicus]GLX51344.1 hypothetical protein Shyhy01_42940 [Streptomyces hygroscopicus subsp. hygroscopicus]
MRIRATVAAVSGALALSALALPAAHAAGQERVRAENSVSEVARAAHHPGRGTSSVAASGTPYQLNATFSAVKVNNGKNISVGTTKPVNVPVSFTLTHGAEVDIHARDFVAAIELYRGSSFDNSVYAFDSAPATCTDTSTTVATCKSAVIVDPAELLSEDAGSWRAAAFAVAFNGQDPSKPGDLSKVGVAVKDPTNSFKLQRWATLNTDAAPEPVKKGKTITVTGKLARADWDDGKYHGYADQPVKLQFRKKGAGTYTTLKTVRTSSTGSLRTTTTATVDGSYRYAFAGTTTTPATTAAGDYVDVK